jgi:hypothetical protein
LLPNSSKYTLITRKILKIEKPSNLWTERLCKLNNNV